MRHLKFIKYQWNSKVIVYYKFLFLPFDKCINGKIFNIKNYRSVIKSSSVFNYLLFKYYLHENMIMIYLQQINLEK